MPFATISYDNYDPYNCPSPYSVQSMENGTPGMGGIGMGGDAANIGLSIGSSIGSATTPLIASSTGLTAALGATVAIPIIGAAIAGITLGIDAFIHRKGPKQKVASTKIVNEVEPYMKDNLDAWNKSNKYKSEQIQALSNFDQLWNLTTTKLNDPSLGEPGQRGITDRSRGGKWDWFSYYRDPIANDPEVKPDPTSTEALGTKLSSLTGGMFSGDTLLMVVGGALVIWGLSSN